MKGWFPLMFDLDAVLAEEKGKSYTFTFGGEKYELPPQMDVRAVAAISAGRLDDGLRLLLNPAQWERMQASADTFTMKALEALFEDYSKHTGMDSVGKSSASTTPLRRTAKR